MFLPVDPAGDVVVVDRAVIDADEGVEFCAGTSGYELAPRRGGEGRVF